MGLAKVAVRWLIEHLFIVFGVVLAGKYMIRIRHLRQSAKRQQSLKRHDNKKTTDITDENLNHFDKRTHDKIMETLNEESEAYNTLKMTEKRIRKG